MMFPLPREAHWEGDDLVPCYARYVQILNLDTRQLVEHVSGNYDCDAGWVEVYVYEGDSPKLTDDEDRYLVKEKIYGRFEPLWPSGMH